MYDTLCCSLALHFIKGDDVIYIPINKREMGGVCRSVTPLMRRTRGAVHQPVNSLPSGWPSISPLYGISHLNNPSTHPALPSAPHPLPLWSVSSVPVLLSSAHSPAFNRVSLLWPEQRAVIPPTHHRHHHHIIAHLECPWHLWNCLCFRVFI